MGKQKYFYNNVIKYNYHILQNVEEKEDKMSHYIEVPLFYVVVSKRTKSMKKIREGKEKKELIFTEYQVQSSYKPYYIHYIV